MSRGAHRHERASSSSVHIYYTFLSPFDSHYFCGPIPPIIIMHPPHSTATCRTPFNSMFLSIFHRSLHCRNACDFYSTDSTTMNTFYSFSLSLYHPPHPTIRRRQHIIILLLSTVLCGCRWTWTPIYMAYGAKTHVIHANDDCAAISSIFLAANLNFFFRLRSSWRATHKQTASKSFGNFLISHNTKPCEATMLSLTTVNESEANDFVTQKMCSRFRIEFFSRFGSSFWFAWRQRGSGGLWEIVAITHTSPPPPPLPPASHTNSKHR